MADTFIQLPADGAGKKIDTRTEAVNSEHREVHVVGDPSDNEGVAKVVNVDPSSTDWGLVVRDVNTSTIAANTASLSTGILVTSIQNSAAVLYTRQANPTAVASDYTPMGADDLGRQIVRPHQVRDLIATAYVTLSTGTEATLLAASAGSYFDLMYIMAANTSNVAQQVDVRAVTAGNVVMSLYIPANSTAGVSLPTPFPQADTGNNWTVDMADFTNSNILISALFSKEV